MSEPSIMNSDAFGQKLEVGDWVCHLYDGYMRIGKILNLYETSIQIYFGKRITRGKQVVEIIRKIWEKDRLIKIYPDKIDTALSARIATMLEGVS